MAKQRVVLVTGGMGGLGETITVKMADAGYKVAVTYSPGNTKHGEWVAAMKERGYDVLAVACDVADFASCARAVGIGWPSACAALTRPPGRVVMNDAQPHLDPRREELRQLVHLAGAEGDVDERELAEHLILDRLRPAAADPDQHVRAAALERPFG